MLERILGLETGYNCGSVCDGMYGLRPSGYGTIPSDPSCVSDADSFKRN